MQFITVKLRQVYGRDTIYPVCEKAELFARLIHQKTLGAHDIALIRQLGYEVHTEQQQVAV